MNRGVRAALVMLVAATAPVAGQELSVQDTVSAGPSTWVLLEGDSRATRFLNFLALQPDLPAVRRSSLPTHQSRMLLKPPVDAPIVTFASARPEIPDTARAASPSSAQLMADNWQLTTLPKATSRTRLPGWFWYSLLGVLAAALAGGVAWSCRNSD